MLGLPGLMGSAGRLDSAAVLLDRLTALYPNYCMVLANTVALRLSQGFASKGVEVLGRAIECDRTRVENYLNGYTIYVAPDSFGRAAAMLGRARQLVPSTPALRASERDLSARTGAPADTAIYFSPDTLPSAACG